MRIILLLVSLLLASCVQVQQFRGPSGGPAYSLRCGGNLDACFEKAGEICPKGYTIFDRTSGTAIMPSGGGFIGVPQHSVAIECK